MISILRQYQAAVLALTGFFLFSITDAAAKFLTGQLGPVEMAFWSGLTGVLSLMLFAPWLGGLKATLQTKKKGWHALRGALTLCILLFNFVAFKHIELMNFYTIVFMAPFITAILAAIFFREKISARNWILILLGFSGVLISMRPTLAGVGWPELCVTGSALFFAIRNMLVPKMGNDETMLSYGFYTYGGIIVGTFFMLLFTQSLVLPPVNTWFLLSVVGAGGAIGVVLVSHAFRIGPTSFVAPLHYSQIIWGLLFGALCFADWPDQWDMVGAAVVCLCGVLLLRSARAA